MAHARPRPMIPTVARLILATLVIGGCATAAVSPLDDTYMMEKYQRWSGRLFQYADLAGRAYAAKKNGSEEWPREIPMTGALAGTTAVYLFETDDAEKVHYVAVRGTANIGDLVTDMRAWAGIDTRLAIPVHRGFQALAVAVYDDLRPRLNDGYRVRITGHSLGGAAAVLLAMYLHADKVDVDEVVTFGQPKVTRNAGVVAFPSLMPKVLRVVDCDDVVPFLPPPPLLSWFGSGYQHGGAVLLLLDGAYFEYADQDIERPFAKSLRDDVTAVLHGEKTFYNHRLPQYTKRLEAKRAAQQPWRYTKPDPRYCGS